MPNKTKNGYKPMKYDVHPAAKLIPPMTDEEYAEFKEDIKQHGQRMPILMKGTTLLDGLHRMQVCEELKLKPLITQYVGNPNDIENQIFSRNLFRRHLTNEQRATIVAAARIEQLEAEAEQRKTAGKAAPKDEAGDTADKIASESKTGQHTARQAITLIKHGTKAQVKSVITGKARLAKVAREAKRRKEAKTPKAKKKEPKKVDKTGENFVIQRFQKFMAYWTHPEQRKVRPIIAEFLKD